MRNEGQDCDYDKQKIQHYTERGQIIHWTEELVHIKDVNQRTDNTIRVITKLPNSE
jgi:hypothetical protein